jgi:hypothetical protein
MNRGRGFPLASVRGFPLESTKGKGFQVAPPSVVFQTPPPAVAT